MIGVASVTLGQEILFEEHFTDGTTDLTWFSPWPSGVAFTVTASEDNPSGDGWVGALTPTGDAPSVTALAGTSEMTDYMIEAQIFTLVTTDAMFPPYNAVSVRWDTTGGTNQYYYFNTMFGVTKTMRLRKYPGSGMGADNVHEWAGAEIPGGEPTESGWHKMGLKVVGDQFWAYWDDVEMPDCPITHDALADGFFGLYAFYMGDAIDDATMLVDDIVVTVATVAVGERPVAMLPSSSRIITAYPNPFNPSTTVVFTTQGMANANLAVFDIMGRKVAQLAQGRFAAEEQRITWNAEGMPAGIYFISLEANGARSVHRVVLNK